jgi:hypothetical protein
VLGIYTRASTHIIRNLVVCKGQLSRSVRLRKPRLYRHNLHEYVHGQNLHASEYIYSGPTHSNIDEHMYTSHIHAGTTSTSVLLVHTHTHTHTQGKLPHLVSLYIGVHTHTHIPRQVPHLVSLYIGVHTHTHIPRQVPHLYSLCMHVYILIHHIYSHITYTYTHTQTHTETTSTSVQLWAMKKLAHRCTYSHTHTQGQLPHLFSCGH